jgi:hypothetical protein
MIDLQLFCVGQPVTVARGARADNGCQYNEHGSRFGLLPVGRVGMMAA